MGFMRYKSRGSEGIDSQTFPVSIAVIIILLSVIQTIKGYRLHQQNKVTQEESSKVSYQRLLLTAALIFCCIFHGIFGICYLLCHLHFLADIGSPASQEKT